MGAVRITMAAAAALALSASPVLAAPPAAGTDRTLTLTGTGTGYVDVTIGGTVRFYDDQLTATKSGKYAGWVVQQVSDGKVLLGGWKHDSWGGHTIRIAASDPLAPQREVVVPGGTFRFYLVTDGTATVKVRVGGLARSRTLTAASEATASVGVTDLGDAPVVTHRAPITSTGRSLVVVGTKHVSTAGVATRVNACTRKTNAEECDPLAYGTALLNVLSSISTTRVSWPGEIAAGPSFAVHQVQSVSAAGRSSGIWLNLDTTI